MEQELTVFGRNVQRKDYVEFLGKFEHRVERFEPHEKAEWARVIWDQEWSLALPHADPVRVRREVTLEGLSRELQQRGIEVIATPSPLGAPSLLEYLTSDNLSLARVTLENGLQYEAEVDVEVRSLIETYTSMYYSPTQKLARFLEKLLADQPSGDRPQPTRLTVRCVVACRDHGGTPCLAPVLICCTQEEYDEELHYERASQWAVEGMYETAYLVFDENDGPEWLFAHFDWDKVEVTVICGDADDGEEV